MKRRYMEVGDLVKIKYDGVVALITGIESIPSASTSVGPTRWYTLLGQPLPFRGMHLKVINESR